MKARLTIAIIFLICLCLSACGSSTQASFTSGNWSIAAISTTSPGTTYTLGGNLIQTGSSVTGTLLWDSNCFDDPVPFGGTLDGDSLNLKSSNTDGQVVTMKATGSGSAFTGTYSVEGGCAAGDNGTIVAASVPPVTGRWNGTIVLPDGLPLMKLTMDLTQSSVATDGYFPLTGTATSTLDVPEMPVCTGSGTIPNKASTSLISGEFVLITTSTTGLGCHEDLVLVGQLSGATPPLGPVTIVGQARQYLFALVKDQQ